MATAADTSKTEADDVEYVAVEEQPQTGADNDDQRAGDDDHDDGEDEDTRLSTSQDDHDEEIRTSENRKKRLERRERQRQAREASERELAMLRQQVNELKQLHGDRATAEQAERERALDAKYREAQQQARQAEAIRAKAIEAGNGEDAIAAERIQRAAEQAAERAASEYHQLQQSKQQQSAPAPEVRQYASEWIEANPWYNPSGGDAESNLVNQIDVEMTQQGYDPKQRAYWEELSHRVSQRLEPAGDRPQGGQPSGRRSPPQASGRGEHAPTSTRKEIYVTPERKQAMQDAGVWDDPVARNRMLKAYSEYDRQNTAR